jgi:hypothetical protein
MLRYISNTFSIYTAGAERVLFVLKINHSTLFHLELVCRLLFAILLTLFLLHGSLALQSWGGHFFFIIVVVGIILNGTMSLRALARRTRLADAKGRAKLVRGGSGAGGAVLGSLADLLEVLTAKC